MYFPDKITPYWAILFILFSKVKLERLDKGSNQLHMLKVETPFTLMIACIVWFFVYTETNLPNKSLHLVGERYTSENVELIT